MVLSPTKPHIFFGVFHMNRRKEWIISSICWRWYPKVSGCSHGRDHDAALCSRTWPFHSWSTKAEKTEKHELGCPTTGNCPKKCSCAYNLSSAMHKCIQMIINAIKCLIIVNDMQKMQKYLNLCSGHLMIEAPWLSARTTELPFGAKPYLCGSQEMDVTSARRGKCSCTKTGMEIDG